MNWNRRILTMADQPVGEYIPRRWRCMVRPCPVRHCWHDAFHAENALRAHYRAHHWLQP